MNNQGILKLIAVLVIILLAGYWLTNSRKGAIVRNSINNADESAVYPAYNSYQQKTLYPTNANSYSGARYSAYPAYNASGMMARSYITTPIATSRSSSQQANYYSNAAYYNTSAYTMPSNSYSYVQNYPTMTYPPAYQYPPYQQYQYDMPCDCGSTTTYYNGY